MVCIFDTLNLEVLGTCKKIVLNESQISVRVMCVFTGIHKHIRFVFLSIEFFQKKIFPL